MTHFLDWFTEPLVGVLDHFLCPSKTPEVTLPPLRSAPPTRQYRPLHFTDYIGQERAKQLLTSYIKGVKSRRKVFPHVLFIGNAGCGKTTLARILATELEVPFVEIIASELSDIINLRMKLYETNGGMLFIDEIHSIPRELAEVLYPMMQDFTHDGEPIQPFTLAGATTEIGELLKTRRPFVDRFKLHLELDRYTEQELATITQQYQHHTFPQEALSRDTFDLIAANCRYTPRHALRLLDAVVYLNGDTAKVLQSFNIIKEGYTLKDLKVLEYLTQNEKGVGLQGLAAYLDTSTENFLQQIEPYLVQKGLIIRTPRGRKISATGITKLGELHHEVITK